MKTLIVIDMQKDFIDGSLGTKEAQAIVPKVKDKIKTYEQNGDRIIYTRDTHGDDYLDTAEGKKLPVKHCIMNTDGWQIPEELLVENPFIINKPSFGYTNWWQFDFDEIEIVGLCTDICVVSNALILKALFPEIPVTVDSNCCAGVTPETHQAALKTMNMCQVTII